MRSDAEKSNGIMGILKNDARTKEKRGNRRDWSNCNQNATTVFFGAKDPDFILRERREPKDFEVVFFVSKNVGNFREGYHGF